LSNIGCLKDFNEVNRVLGIVQAVISGDNIFVSGALVLTVCCDEVTSLLVQRVLESNNWQPIDELV
jgi:hypothetical protein